MTLTDHEYQAVVQHAYRGGKTDSDIPLQLCVRPMRQKRQMRERKFKDCETSNFVARYGDK